MYFVLIWLVSLLVFLTVATGKETRYFLPALPPLLVLLGVELAAFFDPRRRARPGLDRLGFWAVLVLVPGGLAALTFVLHLFWKKNASQGMFTWAQLWQPYAVAALSFSSGAILAAWLYLRRRENASFAALVGTMWLTWLWVWPNLMPVLASQAPFKDFARQLKTLSPEQRAAIRQVAQQDPRYIWYSDVRFGRVIDQLALLEEEGGRRDLAYETRRIGEEIVRRLEGPKLALFVASPKHYIMFQTDARVALEREGRTLPKTWIWMQAGVGREDRRYILFGNRRPDWEPPRLPPRLQAALDKRLAKLRAAGGRGRQPPASQTPNPSER